MSVSIYLIIGSPFPPSVSAVTPFLVDDPMPGLCQQTDMRQQGLLLPTYRGPQHSTKRKRTICCLEFEDRPFDLACLTTVQLVGSCVHFPQPSSGVSRTTTGSCGGLSPFHRVAMCSLMSAVHAAVGSEAVLGRGRS